MEPGTQGIYTLPDSPVATLGSYPVSTGPVGSVDKIRLQHVVDLMQQFLGFGKFDIGSMLMSSASPAGG
jgi:hypothetical protein